jgi:large subunit ribosomal protein L35
LPLVQKRKQLMELIEEKSVPKVKSRKAVIKKFKITGSGKLRRQHSGRRHKLTKKSAKRKRHLKKATLVHSGQVKMYTRLMKV